MPNCTSNKNSEKKTNSTTTNIKDERDSVIAELLAKVESLTKMVDDFANKQTVINNISDIEENHVEFTEPFANKQIRIMSLCYGQLNLSTEPFGRGKVYSFSKYGEVKNILYSTLIDIVNSNRSFAEDGHFYILDKDAVYFLGLSDSYKKILSKDIIDNIYSYDISSISDIVNNTTDEQKYVLARRTIDKIYNNEQNLDLNKCILIGKCCNIDVMAKVAEMKKSEVDIKVTE